MLPSVGKVSSRGARGLNQLQYSARDRRRAALADLKQRFRKHPDATSEEIEAAGDRLGRKWGLV
jgi:hypothetical protein